MEQPPVDQDDRDQWVLARDKTTGKCDGVYRYPLDQATKRSLQSQGYNLVPCTNARLLDYLSLCNGQEGEPGPSNLQASGQAPITRQQHTGPPLDSNINNRDLNNDIAQLFNKYDTLERQFDKEQKFYKKQLKRFETKMSRQRMEQLSTKKMLTLQHNKIKKLYATEGKTKQTMTQFHRAIVSLQTEEHSSIESYRCSTCSQTFETEYRLMLHMVSHDNGPRFCCQYDQCKRTQKFFTEALKLKNHIRNFHGKPYQCLHSIDGIVCSYRTYGPAMVEKHIIQEHGIQNDFKYRKLNL